MAEEFTLDPDELESTAPHRPVRVVATGIAPTAEPPADKRGLHTAPSALPACEACGRPVLVGDTDQGLALALDCAVEMYVALWEPKTPRPRLSRSRGYPVHRCAARAAAPVDSDAAAAP